MLNCLKLPNSTSDWLFCFTLQLEMSESSGCARSSPIFDVSLFSFGLICIALVIMTRDTISHTYLPFISSSFAEGLFRQLFCSFVLRFFFFKLSTVGAVPDGFLSTYLASPLPWASEPRVPLMPFPQSCL